ncbi:MAG: Rieske 2Fe-2S domain-containing protein [Proteobacteria bacterium]|nr:Rieske 2Fe-2S domain-containing protein [Pseudomonadota bacterium]
MNARPWLPLLPLAELEPGTPRAVQAGAASLVLCRTAAGVHALDNDCTHACARMDEGRLRGTRLICPLHGAAFDVRTGAVLKGPATRPLASHAVRVVDGVVEVALEPGAATD